MGYVCAVVGCGERGWPPAWTSHVALCEEHAEEVLRDAVDWWVFREPEVNGRVYFAQRADGLVKIGRSRYPSRRLLNVAREHGTLLVLGVREGGPSRERDLHRKYRADRVEGEWFRPSPALLAEAAAVQLGPWSGKRVEPGSSALVSA